MTGRFKRIIFTLLFVAVYILSGFFGGLNLLVRLATFIQCGKHKLRPFFSDMGNLLITGIAAVEHPAPPVLFSDLPEVEPVNGIGYGQREEPRPHRE